MNVFNVDFIISRCGPSHERNVLKGHWTSITIITYFYGRMSQTGPKKCFIPLNCEKYTNFD